MARELQGLVAGLVAGLGVVGTAFGISAIASHGQEQSSEIRPPAANAGMNVADHSQIVASGQGFYLASCAGCHGRDGTGRIGPTLHGLGDPDAKVAANIKNGFPGQMPAYKSKFTDEQIGALVAYIQSLK